jgi:Spy/CpxP family protein refolding chaperone
MQIHSLSRIALLACALGSAGLTSVLADDTNTDSTPPSSGEHHHPSPLTDAEKAELKKDREQSMGQDASDADKQALREKMHTLMDQINADIVQIDPAAAPLIAKMKAAHHHHGEDGGTPPPQQ